MANYEILKKFVKADVGIAIVSGICLENEADKDLIGRDLSKYFPSLTYGMMMKKDKIRHSLLKEFIQLLQEGYSEEVEYIKKVQSIRQTNYKEVSGGTT
jgi:LysR family transcriptional regulator, putative pyruvate carboxylase regulator